MDNLEVLVFMASIYCACRLIYLWYKRIIFTWLSEKDNGIKLTLALLPAAAFAIILYTLKVLASFDVVNDPYYILFYIFLGLSWVFVNLLLVFIFFDLSWIDDVLGNRNTAALIAITGAFLGLTIIYSGANVGDGPGWWCVIYAAGLGLFAWILVNLVLNWGSRAFERITVNRDIHCGIRVGAFLLASGLILGRASAGDWTSFSMTVIEFLVGWPVLPLTLVAILVERYYISKEKDWERASQNHWFGSIYWAVLYLLIAVFSIVLYPLPENPIYGIISLPFTGV